MKDNSVNNKNKMIEKIKCRNTVLKKNSSENILCVIGSVYYERSIL